MDESEQTPSEISVVDTVASESKVDSKDSSESGPDSGQSKSSTSKENNTTTPLSKASSTTSTSTERSSQMSSKKSSDEPLEHDPEGRGDTQKPVAQSAGSVESWHRLASTQWAKDNSDPGDKSLAGASCGQSAAPQDGAGGPGSTDVMAKMMEMMAKGSAPATPKAPGDAKSSPDIVAMMMKGGGMPNMMAMMGIGGGDMPDMIKGGGMADMKAMMSKMQGNPGGMAKLFDCIIDVSLARPDSDSSDDDEDSITIEIPCQYCSRVFTNQMSLKTHILVAHEHEDTSVLNLKKLVIDKGKRGLKDYHGSRRKQSKDCEKSVAVEAAGTGIQQNVHITHSKVTSSQEDLSAAESSRGIKRGRSETEAVETSGASGMEEGGLHREQVTARLGSGAVPSSCISASPPESRKRSARLRSLRSCSGDSPSQVTTKKSKSGDDKLHSDISPTLKEDPLSGRSAQSSGDVNKPGDEHASAGDIKPRSSAKRTSKHKPVKANSKEPSPVSATNTATRSRRISRKDKDVIGSDSEVSAEPPPSEASQGSRGRGRKGRQSTSVPTASAPVTSSSTQGSQSPSDSRPATSFSTQESQSPSGSRRSLRSRKSH